VYVTPERYRTMGFGVDISDVEDVELRSVLSRATAMVDAICAVPRLPQKFDFRGGTITGERHEWYIDPYERPHPYRFRMFHRPVKTVTQFRIYSTPDIFIELPPADMMINTSAGYVEIASLHLTQFGIWGAGMVPFIGLYYPMYEVDYTYGYEFAIADEQLEPTDAGLFRAQHQFWLSTAAPVIKKNGTTLTVSTDYTIDYDEGTVTLTTLPAATDVITASYTHRVPPEISTAAAMIATHMLGEREMEERGMAAVGTLSVAEVRISRATERGTKSLTSELDPEVASLLEPFIFRSVR
jgi:hypothetical protein